MAAVRSFLTSLRRAAQWMRELRSHECRTIELDANYGRYRLVIGPEYPARECRQRRLPRHSRPIEIFAAIDHIVIHGDEIRAMPDPAEVDRHLQGIVVIHGVQVHIYDAEGEGKSVRLDPTSTHGIEIVETINLAGPGAEQLVEQLRASGRLTHEVYRIIQRDILRAMQIQRRASPLSS